MDLEGKMRDLELNNAELEEKVEILAKALQESHDINVRSANINFTAMVLVIVCVILF